jgi:DnaJ like chaperone protein
MRGYYKWILAALGYVYSKRPIGALIGFVIGWVIDSMGPAQEPEPPPQQRARPRQSTAGDVAMNLVVLVAAVMKADGRATQGELAHVKRFFAQQFGPDHSTELLRLLRDVLQRNIELRSVCLNIRVSLSTPERLQLLHFLIGLAYADGDLDRSEREVLHRIAMYMDITERDLGSLNAMFTRSAPSSAYTVLEVDPKASDDVLKKAYRSAAMKHHPDRVAHLGEEFQKDAAEKFKKVQEAWERIRAERGLA